MKAGMKEMNRINYSPNQEQQNTAASMLQSIIYVMIQSRSQSLIRVGIFAVCVVVRPLFRFVQKTIINVNNVGHFRVIPIPLNHIIPQTTQHLIRLCGVLRVYSCLPRPKDSSIEYSSNQKSPCSTTQQFLFFRPILQASVVPAHLFIRH